MAIAAAQTEEEEELNLVPAAIAARSKRQIYEVPLCKVAQLVRLHSLIVQIVQLVAHVRVPHHGFLVDEGGQRVDKHHRELVICDLLTPVLIVKQFVLVAVGEDAALTEEFVRVALPTEPADFTSGRDDSVTLGASADPLPVLLHG